MASMPAPGVSGVSRSSAEISQGPSNASVLSTESRFLRLTNEQHEIIKDTWKILFYAKGQNGADLFFTWVVILLILASFNLSYLNRT